MGAKRRLSVFSPSHLLLFPVLSGSSTLIISLNTSFFIGLILLFTCFFGGGVFAEEPVVSENVLTVTGGTFLMGQLNPHIGDRFLSSNEQPIHRSTLDDFSIALFEFTLGDSYSLLSSSLIKGVIEIDRDILYLKGDRIHPLLLLNKSMLKPGTNSQNILLPQGFEKYPLTGVTWYGALFLCNALSVKEDLPIAYNLTDWTFVEGSLGYRLPFEAEWEYAARKGGWFYRYKKNEKPVDANIADLSFSTTESKHSFESDIDDRFPSLAPVGSFPAEENGLYDMRGNIQEWCYDYYNERYFEEAVPRNNPMGPGEGVSRVCRGGDWQSLYVETRPTARTHWKPETGEMFLGFRMARSVVND